jgi:hypothetical protein
MFVSDDVLRGLGLVLAAAVVSSLVLIAGHWAPWKKWLKKPLPRVPAYVFGMLAVIGPVSVVLMVWGEWLSVVLLWGCAGLGGLSVVICYRVDMVLQMREALEIAASENEVLRGKIFEGD